MLLGQTPDCQGEKIYDRVVHMHESCEYDIVGEWTGETFKTAQVLKVPYKWVKENKYTRFKKNNKKTISPLVLKIFEGFLPCMGVAAILVM